MNPGLVCGSGPSLDTDLVMAEGLPIAAISTAIGLFPEPTYAIMLDCPIPRPHPRGHGVDIEKKLMNPKVTSVTNDSYKSRFEKYPNAVSFPIYTVKRLDAQRVIRRRRLPIPNYKSTDRTPFNDGDAVAWLINRTMPAAVQWLAKTYDCLIFCGVDLADTATSAGGINKGHLNSRKKGLIQEACVLAGLHTTAAELGHCWLSWTPDPSPINTYMDRYDPGRFSWNATKSYP